MAGLEAAVNAIVAVQATAMQSKPKRPRLVADPRISADDLAEVYHMYCAWKSDKDLYGLVCPPPGGPRTLAWTSKPHPSYMSKMSGLLYDLVKIAPNGKIASSRNVAGLRSLLDNHVIINQHSKTSATMIDGVDSMVRIVLAMYREVKRDEKSQQGAYPRIMRGCSKTERNRIQLVLDRMKLPDSYDEDDDAGESDDGEPFYTSSDLSKNGGSAVAPFVEETTCNQKSMGLPSEGSGMRALGFPTVGLAPTSGAGKAKVGGGQGVLGFPYEGLSSTVPAKYHDVDDSDDDESDKDDIKSLLAEAAEFIPREVRGPLKKPASSKGADETIPKKDEKTTKKASCTVYICIFILLEEGSI